MRQPRGVEILDSVTAKALDNAQYKKDLLADPIKVLTDEGLTIPPKVTKVVICENTKDTIYLVLPEKMVKTLNFDDVNLTSLAHHTGGT